MVDIILKKRLGLELSKDEINFFIKGYVDGEIPDYQVSSLLMAICFNGLNSNETSQLTMAMAYSGDTVDLSAISGKKADKHSTGGVGDTTTLIVVPLVAACGVPVAKMSGRGLGHTGGTIDKLESIPGFNAFQSNEDFIRIVKETGLSVVGQTGNLVPADKKLYALRDVTGTVESIPLIASSVMSKKIAAGADAIVLDVKAGDGAFMKSVDDAFLLAKEMVAIGKQVNRKTIAMVTDMDQPLGCSIGNALEVQEAIRVLNCEIKGEIREVSLALASYMLYAADKCSSIEQAYELAETALEKGKGAEKLKAMINAQGGNGNVVDDPDILKIASDTFEIKAQNDGYIEKVLAQKIGEAAMLLGAGRAKKDDQIDHSVGIIIHKKAGEPVKAKETLAKMYISREQGFDEAKRLLENAFLINDAQTKPRPVVHGVIRE
jgi:pyrimidine-nucleoside phosphorylase